MPKVTRTPIRHRTLWISDVHLGSPGCKAKELTEFLKRNECERLYLVGDIFDGWKMKSHFYWTPDHSRVIKAVISKARRGTKVYYLTGNHDGFMRQFVRNQLRLGKVRLANEMVHTTADGRRLLVTHGDTFDEVVNGLPWLAYAGDAAYEVLMRSNGWLNRAGKRLGLPYWSLSAFAKTQVKSIVQHLSGVDNKMVYRCRREQLQGVVCGHTHHAEVRLLKPGITCHNCGDWVESCTALAEDFEGNIEILAAALPAPPARADARIRPQAERPRRWLTILPQAAERIRSQSTQLRRSVSRTPEKPPRPGSARRAAGQAPADKIQQSEKDVPARI